MTRIISLKSDEIKFITRNDKTICEYPTGSVVVIDIYDKHGEIIVSGRSNSVGEFVKLHIRRIYTTNDITTRIPTFLIPRKSYGSKKRKKHRSCDDYREQYDGRRIQANRGW